MTLLTRVKLDDLPKVAQAVVLVAAMTAGQPRAVGGHGGRAAR